MSKHRSAVIAPVSAPQTNASFSEAHTLAEIMILVTSYPRSMFWRANTGAGMSASGRLIRYSLPGTPDILGCYCGRAIGIEVKSNIGRQTSPQRLWQQQWQRSGGIYILARDVADVLIVMDRLTADPDPVAVA